MKNNRGSTLVEVLSSVVILGIVLMNFFQFFIFSQTATTSNQDKLVAVNIAQTVLEQIKEDSHITGNPAEKSPYWDITHPQANTIYPKTYAGYQQSSNSTNYSITIEVDKEFKNGLHQVKVNVSGRGGRIQSSVKGFVEL